MTRNERQDVGIEKWIKASCRATLVWATGVGKTFAAIKAIKRFIIKNPNRVIVVIVPTEHLKIQWMMELGKHGLIYNVSVEIINSAIKITKKIDFLILDECHRIPSDTYFEVFSQRNPTMVLGLSATYNRLDGKHELLKQYCPICDIITIEEAVKNKWLSSFKEYKVLLEVDDIGYYKSLNEEFYNSFSVFNFDFNIAMQCLTNIIYRRTYSKKIGMSSKDMDAIVFTWNRTLKNRKAFVMDHPKKIEIARKILNYRPFSKAITFSATIKQAEKIGIGYTVHSGKTKKKNKLTIEEFGKLSSGVINTAKSLDEGADIKGLNLAIILCNTSSKTQKTQRVGRVIRYEEGKEAEIFTLVLKDTNEESWFNTSSDGSSYIELNESDLDFVLTGEKICKPEKEAKSQDLLFRI